MIRDLLITSLDRGANREAQNVVKIVNDMWSQKTKAMRAQRFTMAIRTIGHSIRPSLLHHPNFPSLHLQNDPCSSIGPFGPQISSNRLYTEIYPKIYPLRHLLHLFSPRISLSLIIPTSQMSSIPMLKTIKPWQHPSINNKISLKNLVPSVSSSFELDPFNSFQSTSLIKDLQDRPKTFFNQEVTETSDVEEKFDPQSNPHFCSNHNPQSPNNPNEFDEFDVAGLPIVSQQNASFDKNSPGPYISSLSPLSVNSFSSLCSSPPQNLDNIINQRLKDGEDGGLVLPSRSVVPNLSSETLESKKHFFSFPETNLPTKITKLTHLPSSSTIPSPFIFSRCATNSSSYSHCLRVMHFDKVGPSDWSSRESLVFDFEVFMQSLLHGTAQSVYFLDESKLDMESAGLGISGEGVEGGSLQERLVGRGAYLTKWDRSEYAQLGCLMDRYRQAQQQEGGAQESLLSVWRKQSSSSTFSPPGAVGLLTVETSMQIGLVLRLDNPSSHNPNKDCWRLFYPNELIRLSSRLPETPGQPGIDPLSFGGFLSRVFPQFRGCIRLFPDLGSVVVKYKVGSSVIDKTCPNRGKDKDYETIGSLEEEASSIIQRFLQPANFHDLIL